jgi:exoribonuclease R
VQSAIAAPYAHVTAPLRRLVDRWALVVCEAVSAGREVPGWARQSLAALPSLMGISSQRASRLESASVARVEAAVLADRVGERFDATVLELRDDRAVVQLADPPVTATCPASDRTRPGERVGVVLESADISSGAVEFSPAG